MGVSNLSFSEIDKQYYYNGELGAIWSEERTVFRVWSPCAESVLLNLYKTPTSKKPYLSVSMERKERVWEYTVDGNLNGVYYTYTYIHCGEKTEKIDIYAHSSCANGKRGMVIDMNSTVPDGWLQDKPVAVPKEMAVVYELHIRDLSMDKTVPFTHRGKFLALAEEGLLDKNGVSVGIDHIASLGVTHVQLLPIMDFGSVDELAPTFNWGYDPMSYFIPEGSYSTDPQNGFSRVKELRTAICALHKRGIGVILDVVYNHTYTVENSPFTASFPEYYYRSTKKGYSNGSGCGNELATQRKMVRRMICDSLCFWAENYHVDGFRFDLMGLMNIKTLNYCAERLRKINPNILLYGEGWTGGISCYPEKRRAMKMNARLLPNYAMFSDDLRDGLKGSVFSDTDCGYVNGVNTKERRELIKSVFCGGVPHKQLTRPLYQLWASSPLQSVNYVECHDNLTLADKLTVSLNTADIMAEDKLCAALVILSQGIAFIQAGQEFLRSKPCKDGGYDHNSYRSGDSVNCLKWTQLAENKELVDYCRGLISFRKSHPQLRFSDKIAMSEKIRFSDLARGGFCVTCCGFSLIVNPSDKPLSSRYRGEVKIYVDNKRACAEPFRTGQAVAKPKSILLFTK